MFEMTAHSKRCVLAETECAAIGCCHSRPHHRRTISSIANFAALLIPSKRSFSLFFLVLAKQLQLWRLDELGELLDGKEPVPRFGVQGFGFGRRIQV